MSYPPTTLYNLRPTMPIPRTPSAPHFNGWYIEDFLQQIVLHATTAGETDMDRMVKYIVMYSSDQVKETIRYMPFFNADDPNATWETAKEVLKRLYGTRDKPTEYTEDELKDFCRDRAAKSSYTRLEDLEKYYRDFIAVATSLLSKEQITENKYNYYFVLGLTHSMKEWFLSAAPEGKRTQENPPTVTQSFDIIKTQFDKQSLIYEDWRKVETEQAKSVFNERGNRVIAPAISQYVNVLNEAVGHVPPNPQVFPPIFPPTASDNTPSVTSNTINDLAKQLQALTLAMNAMQERVNSGGNVQVNTPHAPTAPITAAPIRRCFICGKLSGQEGSHPLGPRNCPETNRLIAEQLITSNNQSLKYTLPDGNDLPRIPPGWTGGVSSYLRHLRSASQGAHTLNRDESSRLTRSTSSVELMYDNAEVLSDTPGNTLSQHIIGNNGFALDSFPYDAYPTTRSGRDTSQRLDPRTQVNRPDRVQQARAPRENIMIPQVQPVPMSSVLPHQIPQQVRFAPETSNIPQVPPTQPVTVPPRVNVPQPSNLINRNDGWKASRPGIPRGGGSKEKDVEMKDSNAPKSSQPQYHFTSKVHDHADADGLLTRIGQMAVEVPLFQLLGLSPQLSKLMAENTRTKREYGVPKEGTSKSAEYLESDDDAVAAISAAFGPESTERHAYVELNDSINDFVFHCSNAAAQIPTNRFFAMTVGDIKLTINGIEFMAMIDTGSELTKRFLIGLYLKMSLMFVVFSERLEEVDDGLKKLDVAFEFSTEAIEAFELLKHKISRSPVLVKLDYEMAKHILPGERSSDEGLMIVAVDSAWTGAGWALYQIQQGVKAVQPERITIEVPEAPDEVPSVGTVAVTQGCTRKGYTVLGSMMGLQRSFRQCSLHAIWVSLRSAKKKEVPERRTEPID
ncbi:hypothetical protein DFJ43DRAFT_1221229 [Lentinula guzmanii]|uniref:DUF4100 domain-containing protein n=1 Tax=Lentinula guzmanii TaxID=2804957 RepID=A0AA38JTS8_9AGAR|nr:hypothetical protein DFJ43DRAFT_1221229 [Lentinula guzmanii]